MSDVSRPDTGTPGWVIAAMAVLGIFAVIWVLGVVMSAIGFLIKLVLSVAVIAVVAWFIVSSLGGSKRRS